MLRKRARCVPLVLLLAWIPGAALGIVHSTGDGSANTSAPLNDPGWAHVALLGDLTGVYLGGGWVLTADHVPERDAVIGGQVYPYVAGSRVVLETSPGVNADLAVYRITGDPGLPLLTLGTTAPAVGEPVVMIGYGWNRETSLTNWDASWNEVPPGGSVYSGYKRGAGQALRWGMNIVEGTGVPVDIFGIVSTSLSTRFDSGASALADEAQAVVGDSGGAVFYERGGPGSGNWELAGILYTIATFSGQPGDTAVFGTETYAVEVAAYAGQLQVITTPVVPALSPWFGAAAVAGLLSAGRRVVGR